MLFFHRIKSDYFKRENMHQRWIRCLKVNRSWLRKLNAWRQPEANNNTGKSSYDCWHLGVWWLWQVRESHTIATEARLNTFPVIIRNGFLHFGLTFVPVARWGWGCWELAVFHTSDKRPDSEWRGLTAWVIATPPGHPSCCFVSANKREWSSITQFQHYLVFLLHEGRTKRRTVRTAETCHAATFRLVS